MHRLFVLSALLVAAASPVLADDPGNPPSAGARGTVTAWDLSGTRVLEHRFCVRARGGWDYVECGARLREQVFGANVGDHVPPMAPDAA